MTMSMSSDPPLPSQKDRAEGSDGRAAQAKETRSSTEPATSPTPSSTGSSVLSSTAPSNNPNKKRRYDEKTEDEKREERRVANRRSALESRQRRKKLIEDLQATVDGLTNENRYLRQDNSTMRMQLGVALAENQQLRAQQLGLQGTPMQSVTRLSIPHGLLGSSGLLGGGGGGLLPSTSFAAAPTAANIPSSIVQALVAQLLSSGSEASRTGYGANSSLMGLTAEQQALLARTLQEAQQQEEQRRQRQSGAEPPVSSPEKKRPADKE